MSLFNCCALQKGVTSAEKEQSITEAGSFQHVEMSHADLMSYRSFQDYLLSHVGGVEITADGGIVIRGISTFNGSSQPLILMDGMEVQDVNSINPYDIHSVDVLKDGSSTAAYGIRGSNGVILITSKAAYQTKQAEREAKKREKEAAKRKSN